jgi:uncharacterized membrane protein
MLLSIFMVLIVSAITGASYNVFLKKSPQKLLFSFWVAVFTSVGMTLAFYQKYLSQGVSLATITKRIATLATEDGLNYLIVTFIITLGIALKAHLFTHYRLAKIIPILEIGTPLTAFLYFLLGDVLSPCQTVGIGLISVGAFISGFERFYFPNILKPLLHLPFYLYLGAFAMAFLETGENLIVYLTTEANDITKKFIAALHTYGLHSFTNQVVTPLEYFQVTSFFFILVFFLYLLFAAKKSCSEIVQELLHQKKPILYASVTNFISQYLYYFAYQGNDQAVVVALTKFSVPLTLAFAYLTLNEEIRTPELIGVALIVGGGIVSAF